MKVVKVILGILKTIFIVICIAIIIVCGCLFYQQKILKPKLPSIFCYPMASVISGAMLPSIEVGDLVVVRANATYDVGDVVMYKRSGVNVVHRVVSIGVDTVVT